jgi:hypothetical protein
MFGEDVTLIMMLQHKKNEQNLVHGFQEKYKMAIGDGGSFLKKFELVLLEIWCVNSSYLIISPFQI